MYGESRIQISEISAWSGDGENGDFVELYNPTPFTVSLASFSISDDMDSLEKAFDGDARIQGHGYYVLFTNQGVDQFGIAETGEETIYLWNGQGRIQDQVEVPAMEQGLSYAFNEETKSWGSYVPNPGVEAVNLFFSEESGFYDEDFDLEITADREKVELFYTMDGTAPTRDGAKYEGNLTITDRSSQDNVYSARTDSSHRYAIGLAAVPEAPVDKCTVLRVAAYNGETKLTEECRIYFVGFDEKEGYDGLYTASITTDPENLFDYENGIYVAGKYFDEYIYRIANGLDPENEILSDAWENWKGNFSQKGIEWERPASLTIFDPEDQEILSQNVGIRIKGGWSATEAQKSFNIFARRAYSGTEYLDTNLFGETPLKSMSLFAGGQDQVTKLKDPLLSQLSDDMEYSSLTYLPCAVFLDGEYWGLYYITQRYDTTYVEETYGVKNAMIVKNGEAKTGLGNEDLDKYYEDLYFVEENDMSDPEMFAEACQRLDLDSLVDYYGVMIYIARVVDWSIYAETNVAAWRSRSVGDGAYEDGKWRWMMFDLNSMSFTDFNTYDTDEDNYGMTFASDDHDTIAYTREVDRFFDSLLESSEFVDRLAQRMLELPETDFSEDKVHQALTGLQEQITDALVKSNKRWMNLDNTEELLQERVTFLEDFFRNRPYYMNRYIIELYETTPREDTNP